MNANEQESTRERAVTYALGIFAEAYRGKGWEPGRATLPFWIDALADFEPEEIMQAAALWRDTSKWPPTPAELRNMVPRFCRCGRCSACQHRAVTRACLSGPGADLDDASRFDIDDARRRFLRQPKAAPRLGPGSEQPRLGR